MIEFSEDLKKVLRVNRFYIGNTRIRDLKYDKKTETFFMIFENTPAVGVLKII